MTNNKIFSLIVILMTIVGISSVFAGGKKEKSENVIIDQNNNSVVEEIIIEDDPNFISVENILSTNDSWNGVIQVGVPFPINKYKSNSNTNSDVLIYLQPPNSTNQDVIFSVKDPGNTGAYFIDNILYTNNVGVVIITATIIEGSKKGLNFSQDYTIYVAKSIVTQGNYTIREIDQGYILTNYSGNETNIIIPPSLNISIIAGNTFRNKQFIKTIVVPEGVTTILKCAFMKSGIINIKLPSSLLKIEEAVFKDCNSLVSIIIPSNCSSIGNSVFSNCTNLTSITVESIYPPIVEKQLAFNVPSLKNIFIPKNSLTLYQDAFCWNWERFKSILTSF